MKKSEHFTEANGQTDLHNCDSVVDASGQLLFHNRIMGKWLSTKEAASYLGITPNALRIMVHRGKVKAHRLGARLKFSLEDLKSSLQLWEVL